MKKLKSNRLFAVLSVILSFFIVSCAHNDSLESPLDENTDYVTIVGEKVKIVDGTLSFENQNDFQNLLQKIKKESIDNLNNLS